MDLKILLVDDMEVFSDLASAQLRSRGFTVMTVATGLAALQAAFAERPDVILLDIQLPDMSGAEVLKTLKSDKQTASIPVLICSVTVRDRAAVQRLIGLGARGCVEKPCCPDALAKRLRQMQA